LINFALPGEATEGSNARSCYHDDLFHLSFNSSHWTNAQTGKRGKRKAANTSRQNYRVWEGSNARSCYHDDFFHSSFSSSHQTKDQENGKRQGSRVETIEFGREATQGLVSTKISFIVSLIRRIRRTTRQASQENGKRQGRRVDTIEFGTITVGKEGKIGKGSAAWKQICDVSVFGSSTFGSQEETHGYLIVEFPSSWGAHHPFFLLYFWWLWGKVAKASR